MAAGLIALPRLTPETTPYWTGGETGELRIAHCDACDRYHHPPSPACSWCRSRDVAAKVVSGRARLVAATTNHQPWHPALPVPYVTAYVAIDEQPDVWLMTNIVGIAPEEIEIGMPLSVAFRPVEDVWLPLFGPVLSDE